jgi:hypothetical protein
MSPSVGKAIAALDHMTAKQLRERYAKVFGEPTAGNNKAWLVRRIAWRIQANAEGGLSERAKARAAELARDADLRLTPPAEKPVPAVAPAERTATGTVSALDPRLPPPGTILTRKYKSGVVQVTVRAEGFEYQGELYGSLSAVAKAVTGSHCNGFLFFRLTGKRGAA